MTDVLLVVPTLSIGGTERQVVMLATGLRSRGFAVAVAVLKGGGRWHEELCQLGVNVFDLALTGVMDPRTMLALFGLMRRLKPSVVHAFLHGFDVLAELPARVLSVPLIVGSRRELATWMSERHLFMQRLGSALADAVVCNSNAVRRDALSRERGDPGRFVVIHAGVEVPQNCAEEAKVAGADGAPVVLTVANMGDDKGHAILVAAATRTVSRGIPVRFVLAGDGPRRGEIEATAEALVAAGRMQFLGRVDEVGALLATADLFVLPSLREGLPNALLEAMAAGVACVASAVGGVPEAMVGGREGVLVAPGDAEALADAICRLLADHAERARLARAGRRRIVADFGWEAGIDRFVNLYRRGLDRT